MIYPPLPEPHTVEVEATNHCNAKCVFCPSPLKIRSKGFLDSNQFTHFLNALDEQRDLFWLNRMSYKKRFPQIVFAGLGEPTLHPDITGLIKNCSARGFYTQLVTNGSNLSEKLIDDLLNAGLNSLAISLHTLNRTLYKTIMGLELAIILPKIKRALTTLGHGNVDTQIWRVLPPPGIARETEMDQKMFKEFIVNYPFVTVLGPSEPWSRDDVVPNSIWPVVDDDPGNVWCHNLFFTHNIAWDGTAVMCCVDYNRISNPLGNVYNDGFEKIQLLRQKIIKEKRKPDICLNCRKWQDTQYQKIYPSLKIA